MTINSDWIRIWKGFVPRAFSAAPPFRPSVYFIDGQIKLMKSAHIRSWDAFVTFQFTNCVKRAFDMGCKTVVLAFDNYEFVPACKGMTQSARNRKVCDFSFARGEELPRAIPECWDDAIRNRTFKSKVIDLVKTRLPGAILLGEGQKLIIDHNSKPVVYLSNGTHAELEGVERKGESDVKFTSYTDLGPMVIDAIDGDYVPMSLLHLENLARAGKAVPQIAIYRIVTRLKGDEPGGKARKFEYLHANLLAAELCKEIVSHAPGCSNACGILSLFAIVTGCDYTQGLPTVGPSRVWNHRRVVVPILARVAGALHTYEQDVGLISLASAVLYSLVYSKRITVAVNHSALEGQEDIELVQRRILDGIMRSGSMTDSTKARIPDDDYIRGNAQNSLWTLLYWNADNNHPDPYSRPYGFKRAKCGAAEWSVRRAARAVP